MRRIAFLVAYCLCLAACREPATAVMVVVTADPSVQNEAQRLRYVVRGGPSGDMLGSPRDASYDTPGPGSWPVVIPIVPENNDQSRMFSIEVHAVGATGDIVVARAISGFVRRETRALRIHLSDSCRGAASNCPEIETCQGGVCRNAFVDPHTLPPYGQIDAGPPRDGGGLATCGNDQLDPGEMCDDGNLIALDGCEPSTCTFSCLDAAACDDDNDCTRDDCVDVQPGTPERGRHCISEAWIDGTSCITSGGLDGSCLVGVCISAGCGDGEIVAGEVCYDETGIVTDVATALPQNFPIIAAGDFDPNGLADLVVGGIAGDEVHALRNIAGLGETPVFQPAFTTSPSPQFFGVGDFDLDGRWSMFAPDFGCGSCFTRTDVDFAALAFLPREQEPFDGPITSVGLGDVDGDSRSDVVVTYFTPLSPSQQAAAVLLTLPNGDWARSVPDSDFQAPSPEPPYAMVAGTPGAGFAPGLWSITRDGELSRFPLNFDQVLPFEDSRNHSIDAGFPVQMILEPFFPGDPNRMLFLTSINPAVGLTTRLIDPNSLVQINEYPTGLGFVPPLLTVMFDIDKDGDNDGVLVTPDRVMFILMQASAPDGTVEVDLPCTASSASPGDFNGDGSFDLAMATNCGVVLLLARP